MNDLNNLINHGNAKISIDQMKIKNVISSTQFEKMQKLER